jgi:hypothetical protein
MVPGNGGAGGLLEALLRQQQMAGALAEFGLGAGAGFYQGQDGCRLLRRKTLCT